MVKKENEKKEIQLSFEQVIAMYENEKRKLSMLESKVGALRSVSEEISVVEQCLDEIEKVNSPIYVSLGAGIYVKAKIEDSNKFLFGLPAGVFEEISKEDAKKILNTKNEEIKKELEKTQKEFMQISQNLASLNQVISKVIKSKKQ
ncbi:MAG: prefoldin subunit alpha [Candidatus Diapherotrites archaeon]|nr:prefoldin subunit alpha [Candidatus Diapherotrites archaeon]